MTAERLSQPSGEAMLSNGNGNHHEVTGQSRDQVINRGRIARQVLAELQQSKQWYFVNAQKRVLILHTLESSASLAVDEEKESNEKTPLPKLRVDTAIALIRQALEVNRPPEPHHNGNGHMTSSKAFAETPRPETNVPENIETPIKSVRTYKKRVGQKREEKDLGDATMDELFDTLMSSRVALQRLTQLSRSGPWKKLSLTNREQALGTILDGQDIKGYFILPPGKMSGISISVASSQVAEGIRVKEEITKRMREEALANISQTYPEYIGYFEEAINSAVSQTIVAARKPDDFSQVLRDRLAETSRPTIQKVQAEIKEKEETELVEKYNNLVNKIVFDHAPSIRAAGIDFEDMIQEGKLTVIAANKTYDPEKGMSLLGYLSIRVTGRVLDLLRRERGNRTTNQNLEAIRSYEDNYMMKHGRLPTLEETSSATGLSEDRILEAKNYQGRPISGDQRLPYATNSETVFTRAGFIDEDPSVSPEGRLILKEEALEENQKYNTLENALSRLDPRLRSIITMYDIEGLPLHEVGKALGISESRTAQLHKKALSRLKYLVQNPSVSYESPRTENTPLGDFLKELGISYFTFRNHALGQGLGLRKGKGRQIILTPEQQKRIKNRYAQVKEEKKVRQEEAKDERRVQELLELTGKLTQAIPGMKNVSPEILLKKINEGDPTFIKMLTHSLAPLTNPEKELIALRLAGTSLDRIAKRMNTTPESLATMEEAALEGIGNRRRIIKFPSGEIINVRRPRKRKQLKYKHADSGKLERVLRRYGKQLSERERQIIEMRAGLADGVFWTLDDIAQKIGLRDASAVLYYEKKALGKLKGLSPRLMASS